MSDGRSLPPSSCPCSRAAVSALYCPPMCLRLSLCCLPPVLSLYCLLLPPSRSSFACPYWPLLPSTAPLSAGLSPSPRATRTRDGWRPFRHFRWPKHAAPSLSSISVPPLPGRTFSTVWHTKSTQMWLPPCPLFPLLPPSLSISVSVCPGLRNPPRALVAETAGSHRFGTFAGQSHADAAPSLPAPSLPLPAYARGSHPEYDKGRVPPIEGCRQAESEALVCQVDFSLSLSSIVLKASMSRPVSHTLRGNLCPSTASTLNLVGHPDKVKSMTGAYGLWCSGSGRVRLWPHDFLNREEPPHLDSAPLRGT